MKKALLGLLLAVGCAITANAQKSIVLFGGNTLESSVVTADDKKISNSAVYDHVGEYVTPLTIEVPGFGKIEFNGTCTGTQNANTGKNFVQLGKGAYFYLIPASGITLTKVVLTPPTWGTGRGLIVDKGEYVGPTGTSAALGTWTGSETGPVKFTQSDDNQTYTRIMYLTVEYAGNGTGVATVAVDGSGCVQYFDMQGNKVKEPVKGQPVIKKQGAKATKVIVK